MNRTSLLLALLALSLSSLLAAAAFLEPIQQDRNMLDKLMREGNYQDALAGFRRRALDPQTSPGEVANDLRQAIACLEQLGRVDEIDALREQAIQVHAQNWRLLQAAADSYLNVVHQGFLVAGRFERGQKRGGGQAVSATARDRLRALQLMVQALPLVKEEPDTAAAAEFFFAFAQGLLDARNAGEAWRLQYLTDLSQLPDYEPGWYYGSPTRGAPVQSDGQPLYYHVPGSFDAAENDGQRWRWALARAAELAPARRNDARWALAGFCQSQFGVQTLTQQGPWPARGANDDAQSRGSTYALDSLAETETIARLTTGIRRFTLPDEFNYLKIYQQIVAEPTAGKAENALTALAEEFENRRQYPRAAEYWHQLIQNFGAGTAGVRTKRLTQITGNWGQFEGIATQPAGQGATIDFLFRNGRKVHFAAQQIDVEKLLADVKAYLRSNQPQLDWQKINVGDIGYRLVEQDQKQYVGKQVAAWDLDLEPRDRHFDKRITVKTPLTKAGAYLVTATMADGNTSRIVLWVADTAIVKKPMAGQTYYYVADAVTGQPLAGATLELFGYHMKQAGRNRPQVETSNTTYQTNATGQVLVDAPQNRADYSWLITAKAGSGRFAFLGFTNAWHGNYSDQQYNATKVFTITDRPVYRPAQTAKYKFWIRQAQYDADGSSFAGQKFKVQIVNPRGDKLVEREVTADEYGGIDGEYPLPLDAMLGVYQLLIENHGGGSFRVEEYKKPEFEVTVDAPKTPVMLGDKITATVKARYYFGAPVTHAKVRYKVLRTSYTERWFPVGAWDWLYGTGYGWYASDYAWYPGWREWGCRRPVASWWPVRNQPPEIVAEAEVPVGPDGTVSIDIDTTLAKELHGDADQEYQITAEVVDESRRTIVGSGRVLVARRPFQVVAWVDRGFYRAGDTIQASFSAHTLDRQPVQGAGKLTLYKITYDAARKPIETAVQDWNLDTDDQGHAAQKLAAAAAGQYRLSYQVTDAAEHTIEGGYLFTVRGQGFTGAGFRFNHLELVADARAYQPGGKVRLLINVDKADATVLLFLRPSNGSYLAPKVIRLSGKSTVEEFAVAQKDMPNFFVEAVTVADGQLYTETREIVVPPESRVLNVAVEPSAADYKPGQEAEVRFKLTDFLGQPFVGSTVVAVYDKSVEYIAGGSNVQNIKEFFWKWRRSHYPTSESSLQWNGHNLVKSGQPVMQNLGIFGRGVADEQIDKDGDQANEDYDRTTLSEGGLAGSRLMRASPMMLSAAPAPTSEPLVHYRQGDFGADEKTQSLASALVEPTVRSNFADTAFWAGAITTAADGTATVRFKMPENLTTWKVKVWGLGSGTRVGQGDAEVVTRKNLLVRMQAPRFFVETDEVVLSANVHNYLSTSKSVQVALDLDGPVLSPLDDLVRTVTIEAGGEQRVDWRVRVAGEGQAVVRMKALTDEESDAVEMRFPAYVHGMLKTESFAGAIRPDDSLGKFTIRVPDKRRVEQSRLEIRYSPTLAGALVDALPYMVDYPYGCTEQTLNRFLPTVVAQRVLVDMKLNLADIREKRTNLNAQEIGAPAQRAGGGHRFERNPVFDEQEVRRMVADGVQALAEMQVSDGGWGWFSGWGERSWPHTTATVVHGLQVAQAAGAVVPPEMLARGLAWLTQYQDEQLRLLGRAPSKKTPYKEKADNVDTLVYMVLVDGGIASDPMQDALYRDRTELAIYAKALLGLALDKLGQHERLAMILRNIEQYVVQDDENQTAYLRLPEGNAWWNWYGSDVEAMAYYLKLLVRTSPQADVTARLAKYLLNNRKHGTYWNSTRDTALCVAALAEFWRASSESAPDMTIELWIDGLKRKEVSITAENLFTFDASLVLEREGVESGEHTIELRKRGRGPLYYDAYLTNFTLEDPIAAAGLEIKVERHYYKLVPADKNVKVAGPQGQAIDQRVEKLERREILDLASLTSGDCVEIELVIDSKNDYEYLLFEDMKPAGFEPEEVRSGYSAGGLGAYTELRDNRVAFFVRSLARGKHSVSYRMRAETPGRFSALPAHGSGMYAPELKTNSAEFKVIVVD
jgi:hypothetical protein